MRKFLALIALSALALAGCASYPKSSAVSNFAQATTTAMTLLEDAGKMEAILAEKSGYEISATKYILREGYEFPPHPFALLSKERIAARIAIIKAIKEYAVAVGALNDSEQPQKVGEAITKIGSSVINFAKAAEPDMSSAAIQPVFGIISAGATFIGSQRSALAIRATAAQAHPIIARAVVLLIDDYDLLNRRFSRRLASLRSLQKQKLTYIQNDPKLNRIELETRYREAYEADRELSVSVMALSKSTDILNRLLAAHDELQSSEDAERIIAEFKQLVDAIAMNAQELRKLET